MFYKKIIAIVLCLVAGHHAHGMQQSTRPLYHQIARCLSGIQTNFNVLYHNNIYNVTFTRANILSSVASKWEVKFLRPISSDMLGTMLYGNGTHAIPISQAQAIHNMYIFPPQPPTPPSVTAPIAPIQPLATIPISTPKAANLQQTIQRINTILHENEHVINPLLNTQQFAQGQMRNMEFVNQLQQEHTQEVLLDIMFPSRTLTANAVAAMNVVAAVILDGIQVQSPTLLKDRIARLAPAINCITKYADAAIQDIKTLDATTGPSPDNTQIIQNLSDLRIYGKDLLNQLQARYDSMITQQQANTDAFMNQHSTLSLSDTIDLRTEMGKEKVQLEADLAVALQLLEQNKTGLNGITSELNLYKQGYSVDHLTDTAHLLMTELKNGFPGTEAETQVLTAAQQEADSRYVQTLAKVDAINTALSQQNAICKALQQSQIAQRAQYEQLIKTGNLNELITNLETLEVQIAHAKPAGKTVLEYYRNCMATAIEVRIYMPAYNQLLNSLRDNKTIINSPTRLEALTKASGKNKSGQPNLSQTKYSLSPELAAYLTQQGITPSEFHIIIADPLRVQIFKENISLLHKAQQKFPFNSTYDATIQGKIDALVQANHDAISALLQGDIVQAAAFTDIATAISLQIQQLSSQARSTLTANTDSGIILNPPVELGNGISNATVDLTQNGQQGSYPLDATQQNTIQINRQQLQEIFKHSQESPNPSPASKLFQAIYNTEIIQRMIGTLEGPALGTSRGLNPKRIATNMRDAFLTNLKAAFLSQMVEDMGDHAIADSILGTNSSEHDQQLFIACVKPIGDAAINSWQEFKTLSPREQNKIVIAWLFEQLVAAKALSLGGQVLSEAGSSIGQVATAFSEANTERIPAAATATGIEIPATPIAETTAAAPTVEPVVAAEGNTTAVSEPVVGNAEGTIVEQQPMVGEQVVPAIKTEANVIKAYREEGIKRGHIFSEKHEKAGLMRLSTVTEAELKGLEEVDKIAKHQDRIVERFKAVVKDVDTKGLVLKEGLTVIRTAIDGLKVEIHVYLKDGIALSLDGYIGHSGRTTWQYMVYLP